MTGPADLFESPDPMQSKPKRRGRVLVVDDSAMMRKAVARIIQRMGHEVQEASNGKEAVDLARFLEVDLIFLDLQMPVQNGMQTLHAMQTLGKLRATPVVLLTVVDDPDIVRRAAQYGVKDYLHKPAHPKRVQEKVRKYLK